MKSCCLSSRLSSQHYRTLFSAQLRARQTRFPILLQARHTSTRALRMSNNITVTFMGTTSGGGPTETRNCSSLVVDALGNGSLWMVDCAEGTVRQFEAQPYRPGLPRLRMSQVSKIFITHMHADHTMGTLTFLRNVLGIPKPKTPGITPMPPNRLAPRVEIFGPRGIRRMLRMLWHMTHTHSEHPYVVNELLFPGEQPSVAADVAEEPGADETDVRRESECVGRDIWCDENGFWRGIIDISPGERHYQWGAIVDAGPIQHRDPCIGYIIREIPRGPALSRYSALPRKLVILGDTYDPSSLVPLIHDDPPSFSALHEVDPYGNGVPVRVPVTLLVHEATDCYLPPHIDPQSRTGKNRTKERVDAKTIERGHSTPEMAGAFARKIAAERLVLNHIGARFPAPDPNYTHGAQARFRAECMREIEHQAADGWNSKRRVQVQAAWDYLSVTIPPNQSRERKNEVTPRGSQPQVVLTEDPVESLHVERSDVGIDVGATGEARIEAMPVDVNVRGHGPGQLSPPT
ncbi:beta-lactamase-like protein [Daedaleopsis nitida]|nr:beta-lactamase-like protein [Daedaleopsis nitida]